MNIEYEQQSTFTIERFRDGDTVDGFLECRCCRGVQRDTIRLLKFESWELNSPNRARALAAAQQLSDRFRGIRCVISSRSLRRDRYGRILADLIIGDTALTLLISDMGLGWYGVGEPEPEQLHSALHEVRK